MSAGSKIARKQERLIACLLTERTHAEAAVKAGISEATLQRWLRLPDFQDAYRSARRQFLDAALGTLQQLAGEAVQTLQECLSADKAADRIRAAGKILDHAKEGTLQELIIEVESIKREMGKHHGQNRPIASGRARAEGSGSANGHGRRRDPDPGQVSQ